MQKIVVGREARNVIDIDAPVKDNLGHIAKALGKDINDLVVFVLDKPRHAKLIGDIRSAGARIQLHTDGDVAGALMVADPRSDVDVMMGTGGTPEGVIAACAIKGVGGQMLCRLDPQSYVEKENIERAGVDMAGDTFRGKHHPCRRCLFCATGISGGDFLRGVQYTGSGAITHSLAIRAKTGTFRYIESHHNWDRLMQFSAVQYD